MIEVRQLSKHFDHLKAVDGVSFTVKPGEVVGLLGPNGAGKSTTMRMLAGFITPTAGDAMIAGHSVCNAPVNAKQRIGYLPEGAPLYDDMTTAGLLLFVTRMHGIEPGKQAAAIDRAVNLLELQRALHQPVITLSKGFQRRLGLALAIVHQPSVLLLDEPTDGLDPNQKHQVRKLIRELSADTAVLISTHILEEVDAVCHRAIIMADGHLKLDASTAQLRDMAAAHGTVTAVLDRTPPHTRQALAEALDVPAATISMTDYQVCVHTSDTQTIAAGIESLYRKENIQLAELRVQQGSLDDLFREVTRQ